ncbi:hypothetical protein EXIGLDRAFT_777406 [Exidia glandulosa HHB12029]|uniref:G-protein coupled receptors family 1 profile domain-containing protein n=1 Tax=Exidia glandulosa HHB12029 TaxID=1314781 RepID=A0A165D188_EXIGL|nr:hypothetical protein EXIGLDRAFT_777406 [Exidia glandulosa HHB12029]
MANSTVYYEPASALPGMISTIVAGFISLVAVVAFLLYMVGRTMQRAAVTDKYNATIGDTHMTAYFYSLMFSSVLKSLSVVMSIKWTHEPMRAGAFCSMQAAFKLTGNVGTAVWSMVIALHLFNLLFLSLRPIKWSLPAVLAFVWSILLADVLIGPVAFGDFFGPFDDTENGGDGTSCWITNNHKTVRFLLEYLPTGLTLFTSVLVLILILLHLRGNIYFTNGRIKLRLRLDGDDAWHNEMTRDDLDRSIMATVKRLIWFPLAYFILWSPVMVSRLIQLTNRSQPFGFVAFALTTYALTGVADVVLFLVTRRVIMPDGVVAPAVAHAEREKEILAVTGTVSPFILVGTKPAPRPLLLNGGLSRSSSAGTMSSYDSTAKFSPSLETGATIPSFLDPPRAAPLPPVPALKAHGPPSAQSDVSMITSTRFQPRERLTPITIHSARSTPSNFMSMSSDSARSMDEIPSLYTPQAAILSAYGHTAGLTSRATIASDADPGTATSLDIASARTFGNGASNVPPIPVSAQTFGNAARAAGPNVVEPVTSSETVKAKLYGARFSMVGGPMPQYDYERRQS